MRSAWLDIALADYEGHMAEPGIGQAEMLATQFGEFLGTWSPASVAIIGCAGGNGFDRLRVDVTRRVVGIDINPQYIQELAYRYRARIPGLELYVHDIQEPVARIAPVDFIYAALVFEYVASRPVLHNLKSLCRPGGVLVTVLQLPSDHAAPVSESPFTSLKGLGAAMRLVAPDSQVADAAEVGFSLHSSRRVRLSSGKEFAVQAFRLA
jgi:SAM-dependent methyltransferase